MVSILLAFLNSFFESSSLPSNKTVDINKKLKQRSTLILFFFVIHTKILYSTLLLLLLWPCYIQTVTATKVTNPDYWEDVPLTTPSSSSSISLLRTTRDVDYISSDDESDDLGNGGTRFLGRIQQQSQEQQQRQRKLMDKIKMINDSKGIIRNMSDIVNLVRFVLLRGHIVLDASHRVMVKNESRIDRLMDYLHDIQLRRGKHRILPMEDRDLACEDIPDRKIHMKKLCRAATFDCLSASELIQMLPPSITFHQAITRICPLLLFRQSRPICVADVKKLLDDANMNNKKIQLTEPSIERVWIFGVLFVTISILVSMGGLILLPFVQKSSRMTILTFFEGLAVGGLCGSAILHLFPEAFDIVDEKYRTYFWNTTCIFCGIYFFYCIEILIKILKTYYGRNKRKHVPSVIFRIDEDVNNKPVGYSNTIMFDEANDNNSENDSDSENECNFIEDSNCPVTTTTIPQQQFGVNNKINNNKVAVINSTREQLVQCLSTVNVIAPIPKIHQYHQRQTTPPIRRPSKERMVQSIALRRHDHESANTITIDTVAWMIVLGDALLNFIDGLSIGAAFDRNILAGMSISVAVMLEEVTHRLGTFAVLIRAGMSMKQSFFYIFLSACSCYPGLALGIFLGDEAEDASPYIFALSGGFFLYMALVDVMKAMTRTMENASRKNIRSLLHILALQNIGIVLSAISLALLAFYEKEMDFEVQELDEIRKNSFV